MRFVRGIPPAIGTGIEVGSRASSCGVGSIPYEKYEAHWTSEEPPVRSFHYSLQKDNKPWGAQFIKERNPKRGIPFTGS